MGTAEQQSKRRREGARIVFGRDLAIPVPDVPPEEAEVGDAETQAVAAHPAFQAMMEEGRRNVAAGKGIPAEAFFREFGLEPAPAEEAKPGRGQDAYSGRITIRVPKSLHRRLAEQAEAEGVSLNQLILSYLAQSAATAVGS